jgi:DNA polymerase I-like protein with 3'-5' exonuclease and polymerase domains
VQQQTLGTGIYKMILILSEKPLAKWAKSQVIKNSLGAGLNKNRLEFLTNKQYNPMKSYDLVMTCNDSSLRLVANQNKIAEVNCYLLQSSSKVSCPVIPFYHPNECMRDRSRFVFLKKAFKNAYRYLEKDFEKTPNLIISNDPVEIDAYLKKCEASDFVCIDLETTFDVGKINPLTGGWKNLITAIGISTHENEAMCFSRENLTPLQFNTFINRVVKINANANIDKLGQNYVMFDSQVLYWWKAAQMPRDEKTNLVQLHPSFLPDGNLWDIMHMFNILYPHQDAENRSTKGIAKNLGEIIRMYLLADYHKDDSYTKRGIELRRYCALDVVQTFRCFNKIKEDLKVRDMEGYYEKYRLGLGAAVVRRQIKGLNVNKETLNKLKTAVNKDLTRLKSEAHEKFGDLLPLKATEGGRDYLSDQRVAIDPDWNFPEDLTELSRKELDKLLLDNKIVTVKSKASLYFVAKKQHLKNNPHYEIGSLYKKARMITMQKQSFNLNSNPQLQEIFKALKVKLPGGKVDATSRAKLMLDTKLPEKARAFVILLEEYNTISTFYKTYCNTTLDPDGRVRGSFNLEANDTGRSACKKTMWKTGFNLQTFPKFEYTFEDGTKKSFKSVIVPDKGYKICNVDLKSAEMLTLALLAECPDMINILSDPQGDLHKKVAAMAFNIKESEVSKQQRNLAKVINYLTNYGGNAWVLKNSIVKDEKIDLPESECQNIMDARFKTWPEIPRWWDKVFAALEDSIYLTNLLGRKKPFFNERHTFKGSKYIRNPKLEKNARAWLNQSTVTDITKLAMVRLCEKERQVDFFNFLMEVHDSLVVQYKEGYEEQIKEVLLDCFDIELDAGWRKFTIPISFEIGDTYGDVEEVEA